MARNQELPKVRFVKSAEEIASSPTGAPLIVSNWIRVLGIEKIVHDLSMEKHHGLEIEHLLLLILLYSSYGVNSIKELKERALKDKAIEDVIGFIDRINEKAIYYFQRKYSEATLQEFIEKAVEKAQQEKKFRSKRDGIIALDDSTLTKTGKKMEEIAIVYDHCSGQYVLGYVLVSTFYYDGEKGYPINFQFRLLSEEEKAEAERKKVKNSSKIDLRKNGSLLKLVEALQVRGHCPEWFFVSGTNLDVNTLQQLDKKQLGWLGNPSRRTKLIDRNGKRLKYDTLKEQTLRKKPQILEGEGLFIRTKTVFLKEYEELDFIVVSDALGNEMGTYLHLKAHLRDRNMKILEHLCTQEPKDSNKMKIGLELVKRAKEQCKIKAENVAFDSWYFVTWFVSELLMITGITRVISKLKTDQMVIYKEKLCRIDSLWGSVKFGRRNFKNTQTQIRIGSLIVEIQNLGKVKAVFVQELDTCFRIKAEYILVTTDVDLSNIKTFNIYKSRWSIETFYRTAKQRFGLESFHCQKFASIFCHVTFVFLSYLMLANIKNSNMKLSSMTFGEIIDQYLCCIVSVKKMKNLLIAYLSPGFVDSFGLP